MRKSVKLTAAVIFLLLILPLIIKAQNSARADTFYVASWNVENLFDDIDDTLKNDNDFLPGGSKNWTIDKVEHKIDNLTKVINYMNGGCGPDIIGFMEVENVAVLKPLAYKFRDRDYIIAHRDSPDERGIDNALFYDRNRFMIKKLETIPVHPGGNDKTRDILHVILTEKESGKDINVFVNHWSSRVGGTDKSDPKRMKAAETLRFCVDTLLNTYKNASVIIMGDFNDEPSDASIKEGLKAASFNCGEHNHKSSDLLNLAYDEFEKGNGTLMYRKDWEMFDQILINGNLDDGEGIDFICGSFGIVKPPFMVSKDENSAGAPIPTFRGRTYLKGFSDHFPVSATFIIR